MALISGLEPRVPRPPGTSNRSRGGACSKVCVGTTLWPIAWGDIGDFVVTGSRVGATSAMVTAWSHERALRQSMGPKASSGWKPGNKTTPIRKGGFV